MKIILASVLLFIQLLTGSFDITQLQLVNKNNPIIQEITLKEMTRIPGTDIYTRKEAGEAASRFVAAIHKAGYKKIKITSGYRTQAYQKQLFDNRVRIFRPIYKDMAEEMATTIVARPGTSEHQVGLAFDISYGTGQNFIGSSASKWMANNCAQYGFILRYPEGKEVITGVSYEPWHFRYVGIELANYLTQHKLTLEEYYDHFTLVASKTEIQSIYKGMSPRMESANLLQERMKTLYFQDVPFNSPYHEIVHKAVSLNMLNGPFNDNFDAHQTLTNKEFFEMLLISTGINQYDSILDKAAELGINRDNSELNWDDPVKRSDVPYLICIALGLPTDESNEEVFIDRVGQDNRYVNAAYYAGLFYGTRDNEGELILGDGDLKKIDAIIVSLRIHELVSQGNSVEPFS